MPSKEFEELLIQCRSNPASSRREASRSIQLPERLVSVGEGSRSMSCIPLY
jgi:hypothetical protein